MPLLPARAQAPTVKIGVLTDMSGPYQDLAGPGVEPALSGPTFNMFCGSIQAIDPPPSPTDDTEIEGM